MIYSVDDPSLITIDGVRLHNSAARDISQSLSPIDAPAPRRDVNGTLRANSRRLKSAKYRSTLSGTYMAPPALGSVWIGQEMQIECAAWIVHNGKLAEAALERPAAPGSLIYVDGRGRVLPGDPEASTVAQTRYRPVLDMMVTGFNWSTSEHEAETGWSIELEEV